MAVAGTQANVEQSLTAPVETQEYRTPTLTFGEVGYVGVQETDGYASHAKSVGEFSTEILERAVHLHDTTWSVSDSGVLHTMDVDKALRQVERNAAILSQFLQYRADIEVTVKFNTNQFYFGALGITLFPGTNIGKYIDARMVLDPTIVSAMTGDSVIKTWRYTWPMPWKNLAETTYSWPTTLYLDVLIPLKQSKADLADSITLQIWARFVNIKLANPCFVNTPIKAGKKTRRAKGKDKKEAQMYMAPYPYPMIQYPEKKKRKHPADGQGSRKTTNTVDKAVSAMESITIKDGWNALSEIGGKIMGGIAKGAEYLLPFLDKPDITDSQDSINQEASIDLFNSDLPDTNVSVGLYRGHYVDPGKGRMPMSKDWTISDYAQIPGLREPAFEFDANGDTHTYTLIKKHTDYTTYRIPLDYAYLSAHMWKGSLKVCLQFFTASFNSARFVVQYINNQEWASSFSDPYDNGISRVINVKGDTTDVFTLPWMSLGNWQVLASPQISVTCDSVIASSDTTTDPSIYLLVWVSGGPDISFAFPRKIQYGEWGTASSVTGPPLMGKKKKEAQAAIGDIFKREFPPIIEDSFYEVDNGFCTGERIGSIVDMCKRYTPIFPVTGLSPESYQLVGFRWGALDDHPEWAYNLANFENLRFRDSFFGQWRSAFYLRSGGYRWRYFSANNTRYVWHVTAVDGNTTLKPLAGTHYLSGNDGVSRLTIPQLTPWPFEFLRDEAIIEGNMGLSVTVMTGSTTPPVTSQNQVYLAARDDLQFGYPILPEYLTVPESAQEGEKPNLSLSRRSVLG